MGMCFSTKTLERSLPPSATKNIFYLQYWEEKTSSLPQMVDPDHRITWRFPWTDKMAERGDRVYLYIYIYICKYVYIHMYMCVCVCVFGFKIYFYTLRKWVQRGTQIKGPQAWHLTFFQIAITTVLFDLTWFPWVFSAIYGNNFQTLSTRFIPYKDVWACVDYAILHHTTPYYTLPPKISCPLAAGGHPPQ